MKRGEIWLGNLNPTRGAEVGKIRPALIVQADFLTNRGSATVVVLPLTTQVRESLKQLRITSGPGIVSIKPVRGQVAALVGHFFDIDVATSVHSDGPHR